MQPTDEIYKRIINSGNYVTETKLEVYEPFGTEPLYTYYEDQLWSLKTRKRVFKDTPTVGEAISGEIEVVVGTDDSLPTMAKLRPYIRLHGTEENLYQAVVGEAKAGDIVGNYRVSEYLTSEWMPKGIYYIDTRAYNEGNETLSINGFDAMLMAEQEYESSELVFPAGALDVANEIAHKLGIKVDERTKKYISNAVKIPLPTSYTYRETLRYIAAIHCGSFIINDAGELLFVGLNTIPPETFLLINEKGNYIMFGGVRILLTKSSGGDEPGEDTNYLITHAKDRITFGGKRILIR